MKKALRIVAITLTPIVIIIGATTAYLFSGSCGNEIISKASDENNKAEFIHVRRNCGATTGYSHHVYIIPVSESYENHEPILVADKANNLSLSWREGPELVISYDNARIFSFTNFWRSKKLNNYKYIVKVKLNEKT